MSTEKNAAKSAVKPRGKWKRRFRNLLVVFALGSLFTAWLIRPHVRTLQSLKQIEGTNVYVMDYYADYDMDEIRREGMDVKDIEGTYIDALFPSVISPVARLLKTTFVPNDVSTVESTGHHCSSIARHSNGRSQFGRNFDSPNDAILVLRVHKKGKFNSVSIIDLEYLNMNRDDLQETSLISRIPLLFSPYYVMDGVNQHGLAVSAMSVPAAKPPSSGAPKVTQASLMRLLLDYCESVDDAIAMVANYDVSFAVNPEHLMLMDASGEMAIVEFVDGKTRVIRPAENWLACTNHQLWPNSEEQNDRACDRYRRGSDAIDDAKNQSDDETFVNAVREMSVDDWTMWTSLYDLNQRTVIVLYKSNPKLSYFDNSLLLGDNCE